jgi:hypothetical protein
MKSSSGTLGGDDLYSVFYSYKREFIREFERFFTDIRKTEVVQKEFNL